MITAQEILDWRQNPTTCKILELFKKRREDLKEELALGRQSKSAYKQIAGICEGYQDVLDVDYEYFIQEYDLTKKEEEDGLE